MTISKKRQEKLASMPKEGFHFDAETHLYVLDGKPLTGNTTILGVIAKPALIQWAADMAVEHLGYNQPDVMLLSMYERIKAGTLVEYFELLKEARTVHAKRKKVAGDIGTIAHDWIEQYAKAKIAGLPLPMRNDTIGHMTDNFVKWANDNKVEFLASELQVYSRKHWYAGTLDLLVKINGKVVIVDIKTGSGIYPEHFFQMGGYQIAVEEMEEFPHRIEGHIVLNIKKDGKFDLREYHNYELNKQAFLAALTLYRAIEQIKL